MGKRPSKEQTRQALAEIQQEEIPFDQAPPIKGSNFEALKDLAVLDVKTHNFVDAWKKGYTGDGVTVGVLDGGTDFGHPDLIGTWQTWSGQTGVRAGWNGWPKAFDPYGTLQFLSCAEPDQPGPLLVHADQCAGLSGGHRRLPGQLRHPDRSIA